MRRALFAAGSAWMLLLAGTIGLAQSAEETQPPGSTAQLGKDLTLQIGNQFWINNWQTGQASAQKTISATDLNVGFLPQVTLKYKDFFISGSGFLATEYDFGTITDTVPVTLIFPPGTIVPGQNTIDSAVNVQTHTTAQRWEAEGSVGYFVHPRIALKVGYKGVFQDYTTTSQQVGTPLSPPIAAVFASPLIPPSTTHSTTNYNGIVFGVAANAPLGPPDSVSGRFSLFGSALGGYLWVSCTPSCSNTFTGATYANGDINVAYGVPSLPGLSLSIGFRAQVINSLIKNGQSGPGIDLTYGPMVGVYYRF